MILRLATANEKYAQILASNLRVIRGSDGSSWHGRLDHDQVNAHFPLLGTGGTPVPRKSIFRRDTKTRRIIIDSGKMRRERNSGGQP